MYDKWNCDTQHEIIGTQRQLIICACDTHLIISLELFTRVHFENGENEGVELSFIMWLRL
jgi:hypothetical protein